MATLPEFEFRTVQASEAKTHFLRILDDVQRGDAFTVTRHGKEIARILPVASANELDEGRQQRIRTAISRMEELRQRVGSMSMEEILSARDEGRM